MGKNFPSLSLIYPVFFTSTTSSKASVVVIIVVISITILILPELLPEYMNINEYIFFNHTNSSLEKDTAAQ